ncbi:hypothetical protein PMG71_06775 [Roseofilum sp. BLCC_M154]|uniref:Cysteine dioxygenase n=1 Tax=Roseofilum acuticapitatum BLCC-M154 TaxID=3022444 RepID=A0ABT7AQF3_9CYAN|nr:hypothetical protein [Roseofilum acuticapitatum]MDJ1169126.1 hypothetical protein [Roseofilum acuticapitatum BLCC-M154]
MQNLDVNSLFQQLLHYRDRHADFSTLGPWLKHQVIACSFPDINQLPFESGTYTRNYMAREKPNEDQGFEALIIRWDKRAKTPVHGHPTFSFYHVITGLFNMEIFTDTGKDGWHLQKTQLFCPSDTTWFLGKPGRYDNFIHRITCLEPGHTFHIYSDNAQKGMFLSKNQKI